MTGDPARRLADLLEEERAAILSADWPRLGDVAAAKERCLSAMTPAEAAALAPLAGRLDRNRRLLRAALDGLRDAARRHASVASAHRLVTYDASGQRAEMQTPPRSVERKA